MNQAQWLSSTDPAAMLKYLQSFPPDDDGIRWDRMKPLISDRKLRLLDDAFFSLFKLNIDDMTCQANPPAGAADIIRDVVGNSFSPVTLPAGEPQRCKCATRSNAIWECAGCSDCHGTGTIDGPCPWLTETVLSLAANAYEDNGGRKCPYCNGGPPDLCDRCDHNSGRLGVGQLDPDRLAVLSDAAEEAGCDDERVLRHLRGWRRCTACIRENNRHHKQCVCFRTDGWLRQDVPFFRGDAILDLFLGKT